MKLLKFNVKKSEHSSCSRSLLFACFVQQNTLSRFFKSFTKKKSVNLIKEADIGDDGELRQVFFSFLFGKGGIVFFLLFSLSKHKNQVPLLHQTLVRMSFCQSFFLFFLLSLSLSGPIYRGIIFLLKVFSEKGRRGGGVKSQAAKTTNAAVPYFKWPVGQSVGPVGSHAAEKPHPVRAISLSYSKGKNTWDTNSCQFALL